MGMKSSLYLNSDKISLPNMEISGTFPSVIYGFRLIPTPFFFFFS